MASWRSGSITLGGNRTTTTVTTAPSAAVGDRLITVGYLEDDRTPTYSGWTQYQNVDHGTIAMDMFLWHLFLAGAPAASYNMTNSPATWTSLFMAAVQNASSTIAPVASAASFGTGTTATANSVTPVGNNACVIFHCLHFSGTGVPPSPPTGFTQQQSANDNIYIASLNLGGSTAGVALGTRSITVPSGDWIAGMTVVEDVATVVSTASRVLERPFRYKSPSYRR